MCTTVQAASAALPQGPSLRSGLCCPGPSSLIWSHAPHLQAQLDFTAMRLIRAAFAVPLSPRLGDPRVDPCFRWHTFSTCRPPGPTGSSFGCLYPVPSPMTLAFDQRGNGLGTSNFPTLRFSWGDPYFEASLRFTFAATCRFACSPVGADWVFAQPTRAFTFGLPTD